MRDRHIRANSALRATLDHDGIPLELLMHTQAVHSKWCQRYDRLDKYYTGQHPILYRQVVGSGRPNNRIVCNHAKYITDMVTGYLLGDPVRYSYPGDEQPEQMDELARRIKRAGLPAVDPEIAKDMSVFGVGIELLYYSSDEVPVIKSVAMDPRQAYMIYDDTVECKPLCGVHYYSRYDSKGTLLGYEYRVYTPTVVWQYFLPLGGAMPVQEGLPKVHQFSDIPLNEYGNGEERSGDFEGQISLIDAYNLLQSDRVNDVERFVQAILFLKGFGLDDDSAGRLRTDRILQAPTSDQGADAKWLTNALQQADVEVIRKGLEADIHKFSMVPELTDENFAGNASGVAMRFKLLGFDQLVSIKERYIEQGLRRRLRLLLSAPNWAHQLDPDEIELTFTHAIPVDEVEQATKVQMLSDVLPTAELLKMLPWIQNVPAVVKQLEKEKTEAAKRQRDSFGALTMGGEDDAE